MGFVTETMQAEAVRCIARGQAEIDTSERIEKANFLRPGNIKAIVEKVCMGYCRVYLSEATRTYLRENTGEKGENFTVTVQHSSITQAVSVDGKCQDTLLEALTHAEPSTYGYSFNVEKRSVNVVFRPPAVPSAVPSPM